MTAQLLNWVEQICSVRWCKIRLKAKKCFLICQFSCHQVSSISLEAIEYIFQFHEIFKLKVVALHGSVVNGEVNWVHMQVILASFSRLTTVQLPDFYSSYTNSTGTNFFTSHICLEFKLIFMLAQNFSV